MCKPLYIDNEIAVYFVLEQQISSFACWSEVSIEYIRNNVSCVNENACFGNYSISTGYGADRMADAEI